MTNDLEILDVWVSADNKEILNRGFFLKGDYVAGKFYDSAKIGLFLKCKSTKWRLGNFSRAHAAMK